MTKHDDPAAAACLCVSGVSVQCSQMVKTYRSGKGMYAPLYSLSSSPELALTAGPCELAAGPCELAAGPW